MKIDRDKYPVIGEDDAQQFISQLKPMEVECFWEAILNTEQVQNKMEILDKVKALLADIEERILDLKDANNEYEYEFDKIIKFLKNE